MIENNREPECKGEYFEAGHHGVNLYQSRPKFNDKVASFVCDTSKPSAAPERWEWTAKSQPKLCARVDKLSLDFELANNYGSGTYDKIKLDFEGAGQKPHVIVEGPSPGFKISQEINMLDIFGLETVALDQIKRLRLLDEMTDHWFGGDAWEIPGKCYPRTLWYCELKANFHSRAQAQGTMRRLQHRYRPR